MKNGQSVGLTSGDTKLIVSLDEWILSKGKTDEHSVRVLNYFHERSVVNAVKSDDVEREHILPRQGSGTAPLEN